MAVSTFMLLAAAVQVASGQMGNYGIDVAVPVSAHVAACLANTQKFAIVRAFRSIGEIDGNAAESVRNIQNAGIFAAVYVYPNRDADPVDQAGKVVDWATQNGYQGPVYVDVEGNWKGDATSNCKFLLSFLNTLKASNSVTLAIYATWRDWGIIFGSPDACPVSQLTPYLWYAHYDKSTDFSDFKPFGGWTKPQIKQFAPDVQLCGIQVDLNYTPSQAKSRNWLVQSLDPYRGRLPEVKSFKQSPALLRA